MSGNLFIGTQRLQCLRSKPHDVDAICGRSAADPAPVSGRRRRAADHRPGRAGGPRVRVPIIHPPSSQARSLITSRQRPGRPHLRCSRTGGRAASSSAVLLRLAYLAVTDTFTLVRLLPMSDREKDIEILALRHQLLILQRQVGKPGRSLTPTAKCSPDCCSIASRWTSCANSAEPSTSTDTLPDQAG
jgi:hypothetical protein